MVAQTNEMSHKMKLITSIIIYFGNFTLGLGSSFIPASLLELSHKFDTDISTISKVFTIMTFSFLLGAIASGFVLNLVNRQIASPLMLITLGTAAMLFPLVESLTFFFVLASIAGVMCAGFSTAQIVWIIDLWEKNAAVYIQVQHFTFALGTVASPLLMKFFLPQNNALRETSHNALNSTGQNLTEINELVDAAPLLYVPFVIGGSAAVFGGILFFILYFFTEKQEKKEKIPLPETVIEHPMTPIPNSVILVLLSALVLGAYQGMEVCSFQFIPTFTHFIALRLSQPEGSLVLSALAAAFTLGRAVGIFIILKIRPEILLVGNFVLVFLGNSLLLTFGNSSLPALWSGAIILGVGYSTLCPSFYGFIEKHMKVSNTVGAVMNVASGLAPTIYPIIIGTYIAQNPFILMYTNYFSLILCASAFTIIYILTRKQEVKGQQIYLTTEKINFEIENFGVIDVEILPKSKDADV